MCVYIYIYMYVCCVMYIGMGFYFVHLNGYLVLQGSIRFRTPRLKQFPKVMARERLGTRWAIREMGGAPRNPAPRNHFLVRIVKPSGCHCTDGHLTSRVFTEDQQISQSADAMLYCNLLYMIQTTTLF